jgi:hypothetical protein
METALVVLAALVTVRVYVVSWVGCTVTSDVPLPREAAESFSSGLLEDMDPAPKGKTAVSVALSPEVIAPGVMVNALMVGGGVLSWTSGFPAPQPSTKGRARPPKRMQRTRKFMFHPLMVVV